uniref:ATP synthase F0 subunit 8 n=1 Tax=Peripatoides sp. DVL-2010 TaxID=867919 RepID=F8RJ89_9BILA|nr:ATP synthase F0 subunit 8 [Peripatoides sp. DVL-2010]
MFFPQMKPLMWMFMMPISLLMLLFFMMMIFFIQFKNFQFSIFSSLKTKWKKWQW